MWPAKPKRVAHPWHRSFLAYNITAHKDQPKSNLIQPRGKIELLTFQNFVENNLSRKF